MNDKDFTKSVYWTAGMLSVHCVAGCGLLALLVYVVPKCVGVFADFEVDLPVMTQLVISLPSVVVDYWYLLIGPAIGIDVVVFIWLWSKRWARFAWFVAVLGAMILFAVFVAVALGVPLINLSESLN